MPERIIVDPDITACMREDRRVYLSHLVNSGRRVRVMNPLRAATWEGVIFGLADHPTLLMRLDDGRERTLPQHFAVEEIEPLPEPESAQHMKLYLAGPMRGYPEFNHPAFREAACELRARGHEVFSPAEHDNANGFDFTGSTGTPEDLDAHGFDLRKALAADLDWICRNADGLVVLPGYQRSLGATAEVATAHALGLPVWELAAFIVSAGVS